VNRRLNATLGCFTVFVIVCIFAIEGTLALLRQRTVVASVEIQNAAGLTVTPTPQPTAEAGSNSSGSAQTTPASKSTPLVLAADEILVVHVRWAYHIGPRFPDTSVAAVLQDSKGQVVATASYIIQCGAETIDCNGDQPLPLKYGIKDGSGTAEIWPADTYTLDVSSAIADLKPTSLLHTAFTVKAAA